MNKTILIVILLAIANGRLLLNKHKASMLPGWVNQGYQCTNTYVQANIQNITDNFVNPQAAPINSSQWTVFSGSMMPNVTINSCLGFIFYPAMQSYITSQGWDEFPTLIWLNGGPGSSSQLGNFEELGPILVKGNDSIGYTYTYNTQTWGNNYNLLFVDNPVGTGLSYADNASFIPTNQSQVAEQFYGALQQLYTNSTSLFSVFKMMPSPLFITGESYAGKYIPAIAEYVLGQNQNPGQNVVIPLKGIAVGDGFTDPKAIQSQLNMFAYNLGLLDVQESQVETSYILQGNQQINQKNWLNAQFYFDQIMGYIGNQSGMQDPYNFQNQQTPEPLSLTQFLNNSNTKTMFGLPQALNYAQSSQDVYEALSVDFMQSDCVQRLENVLNYTNFPVLYYNGQNDVIVCTPCTESWLDRIQYSGNSTNAQGQVFVAGYNKTVNNLYFATVNKAGHMVPTDQPYAAYTMITSWVKWAMNYKAPAAPSPQ